MNTKIIEESLIPNSRNKWEKKQSVLVGGCFDLLHYGHFTFLEAARKEGEFLLVALEPDEFITTKKGRPPIHTQSQRAEILAGLVAVDVVIMLPFYTDHAQYADLVKMVHPAIIAVTKGDKNKHHKERHAGVVGASVREVVGHVATFSTSSIISYANLLRD